MIPTDWFIARRYLFSRERKALISVITLISVAGVAVGVAALIIVLGVIDGIDDMLFGRIADLYPHVRVKSASGEPFKLDESLLKSLRARPEVRLAEPAVEKFAIFQTLEGDRSRWQAIRLIGADELGENSIYKIPNLRTHESIQMEPREILPGFPLFAGLALQNGDAVRLNSTDPVRTALGPTFKGLKMTVKGWYNTGFPEFDESAVFARMDDVRELFLMPAGTIDYIHIKLRNPDLAPDFKRSLNLGPAYEVTTWGEENSEFFGALRLEKLGLSVILLLIVIVAALNIIGTLILMVIEKTREVGILRAVGASRRTIARIFLLDGITIGLFGTLIGLAIGIAGCLLIPRYEIDLPAAVLLRTLPVKIVPSTIIIIVVASMIICTLAALFPARAAAKLNPVEALRYD